MSDGKTIVIENAMGHEATIPIKNISVPNPQEILMALSMAEGKFNKVFEMYFPMKISNEFGMPVEILLLDKKGERDDPELAAAVLSGVEIDASSSREEQAEKQKKQDKDDGPTIDI